jgi:hypothetical protein
MTTKISMRVKALPALRPALYLQLFIAFSLIFNFDQLASQKMSIAFLLLRNSKHKPLYPVFNNFKHPHSFSHFYREGREEIAFDFRYPASLHAFVMLPHLASSCPRRLASRKALWLRGLRRLQLVFRLRGNGGTEIFRDALRSAASKRNRFVMGRRACVAFKPKSLFSLRALRGEIKRCRKPKIKPLN